MKNKHIISFLYGFLMALGSKYLLARPRNRLPPKTTRKRFKRASGFGYPRPARVVREERQVQPQQAHHGKGRLAAPVPRAGLKVTRVMVVAIRMEIDAG